MKRNLFLILIILNTSAAISQVVLPDNFTIGDYVEVSSRDSIRMYLNCTGIIVSKKCADYYRVGKIDPIYINVKGKFYDYFLNGKLYFEASIENNKLEGAAKYYYSNGQIKEEGMYVNDQKAGKWIFYYANGSIQKVYFYENGEPLVIEAFNPDNELIVKGGNGYLKTEFSKQNVCSKFEASGEIINGKKNGKWVFSNVNARIPISVETYKNGQYVNTIYGGSEHIENPNIGLTVYYGNERLLLTSSHEGCPGATYKNVLSIYSISRTLQKAFDSFDSVARDQWMIVGVKINAKNKLSSINVASSINDIAMENYVYNVISKIAGWEASIFNGKKVESEAFFSILVDGNKIIVPENFYREQLGLP